MWKFKQIQYNTDIPAWMSIKRNTADTAFETYYWNPDFYRYKIVTSVASNNLTIAIKNYNWDDASAGSPIKIQIGDTIRTITSALSATYNAWTNYLNLWWAQLATLETDLFVYLWYDTTWTAIRLTASRIPWANKLWDFTFDSTNEKWLLWTTWINNTATDYYTNIWRINAILSAWAWYTWSIPTTSIIINRQILESRLLPYTSTNVWGWPALSAIDVSKYQIIWNNVSVIFKADSKNLSGSAWSISYAFPFTVWTDSVWQAGASTINDWSAWLISHTSKTNNYMLIYKTVAAWSWTWSETGVSIRYNTIFNI